MSTTTETARTNGTGDEAFAERGTALGDPIVDPLHGSTYWFQRRGEDLYVETVLDPSAILPKHKHPIQRETWWVIEGEVEFFDDGWGRIGPETGKVVVEPGQVHGLRNRGTRSARLGCDVEPAMDLEAFLTEASWAAREGLIRRGGAPTSLKGLGWLARFMRRHSDQTQMTFPPPFAVKLLRPFERIGV